MSDERFPVTQEMIEDGLKAFSEIEKTVDVCAYSDEDWYVEGRINPTEICKAIYRAMRAREPETGGWLPIETAPKDGTRIDLWIVPPPRSITTGPCRITECWFFNDGWRTDEESAEDGWTDLVWEPTNWRPLPAPPQTKSPAQP